MDQENKNQELIDQLNKKYENLGENPNTYLEGLLQAKPISYWDYIEVETLFSLQKPRTNFKDEKIFIMYHQVTELVLGMMLHELKQLVNEDLSDEIWIDKINRLNRYTSMLITSFGVMSHGMDYDDYNVFRKTLAPASGFQSVSFRYVEIYCTQLKNLLNEKGRERISNQPTTAEYFEHIYWKDAGMDRKTGKKTLTLTMFEEKYQDQLIAKADEVKGKTLEEKFAKMKNPSKELVEILQEFDQLYNVKWPMVHLETAQRSEERRVGKECRCRWSQYTKYLHPTHQQRKFFPKIWKG